MAMNLKLYTLLEQETLRLDEAGDDELAERLRTVMDFVWYQRLSAAERANLNSRGAVGVALVASPPRRIEAENTYAGANLTAIFTGTRQGAHA